MTDVLCSAAGNSADELWCYFGIFGWDFEVGDDLWNPVTRTWQPVGCQPYRLAVAAVLGLELPETRPPRRSRRK